MELPTTWLGSGGKGVRGLGQVLPSHLQLMLCSHFSPVWFLQLVPKLSRNYLKEGYMEKTGPKVGYKCFCNTPKTGACSVWMVKGLLVGQSCPLCRGEALTL